MADTILQLEDFQFSGVEVPQRIPVGGEQATVVHRLIGGIRVIDVMGRDDEDLEWSGWLLGSQAVSRAKYLDNLRVAGQSVTLTWGEYSYQVIVKRFSYDYETFYRIPYRIVCQVLQDNSGSPASNANPSPDDAINTDLDTITSLAATVGDPTLLGLTATLNTAIGSVSTFISAPQSLINGVLTPLAAVQTQVNTLLNSANVSLGANVGFGGVSVGLNLGGAATDLGDAIDATAALTNLYQISDACGRIANNLGAISASDLTITVAGGNLFQVASEQYGDATAWTVIAKANGLTDPFISGVVTLTIPPQTDNADGVLGL